MGRKDKQERKAALSGWKEKQRQAARALFPLPEEMLVKLFQSLDAELADSECDHSLRLVRGWCQKVGVEAEPVVAWLGENGGFCDCEALDNAEEAFEDARGQPDETH